MTTTKKTARTLEFDARTAHHINWDSIATTARELGADWETRAANDGAITITMFWRNEEPDDERHEQARAAILAAEPNIAARLYDEFVAANTQTATEGISGNPWLNDAVQFPRLLAEIMGVGLTKKQYDSLCDTMDLTTEDIDELFDRADAAWQKAKA